jgi:hypothetical protein
MEDTLRLLKIAGCENTRRQADVIFVHGLDGDARTTWHPPEKPSAPSSLNFGVEPLQCYRDGSLGLRVARSSPGLS